MESNTYEHHELSQVLQGNIDAAEAAIRKCGHEEDSVIIEDSTEAPPDHIELKHVKDIEKAVLCNLSQSQILHVVDRVIDKQPLLDALISCAPKIVDRVRETVEGQKGYETGIQAADEDIESPENNIVSTDINSGVIDDSLISASRFIPLRLTYDERRYLRLLESALEVSEYTDKIDVYCAGNKARKIAREIRQMCAILSGLVIAHDYEDGQRLLKDNDFAVNAEFFRAVFEIGRRYKILNPEKMRSAYGKLMYLLMDAQKPDIQQLLEFQCDRPVHTVYSLLTAKRGGLDLLRDPLLKVATREIMPEGKSRATIDREIREKENAVKTLARKYAGRGSQKSPIFFGLRFNLFQRSETQEVPEDSNTEEQLLTVEEIEQCIYSLGDHNTYLRFNRGPCDRMIQFLKDYFDPNTVEDSRYSLAITYGSGGARLTHSHNRQYLYVLQSLTLWREILSEMFVLWAMAEMDMLQPTNPYRLRDTGQGLNRVQEAPRVSRAMHTILHRVQRQTANWVGSSAVHLGDHNVPNALLFIDKYTQVPRILAPIVLCLDKLSEVYESQPGIRLYFDSQFGGVNKLRKLILCDFFRHAFDGSGADNFYDAGSCIDGRLTSAWAWCSNIEKKDYFHAFLLTGFTGFDGKF